MEEGGNKKFAVQMLQFVLWYMVYGDSFKLYLAQLSRTSHIGCELKSWTLDHEIPNKISLFTKRTPHKIFVK